MSGDFDPYKSVSFDEGVDTLDDYIQGRNLEGSHFTSVRGLTESERSKNALTLPVEAGTRVAFVANLGSVLSYDYVPDDGVEGTVVMVRTADGDCTATDDNVFVKWDDGHFMPVLRHHLRRTTSKVAQTFVLRTADFGDLGSIFAADDKTSDLVHKSTKDLWSCEEKEGEFVISRLFDDSGEPLKG